MDEPAEWVRLLNITLGVACLVLAVRCVPAWRAASEPTRLLLLAVAGFIATSTVIATARAAIGFPTDLLTLLTTVSLALAGRALHLIWRAQRRKDTP